MAKLFDPAANLPQRLQLRIDAWEENPPKSQFQAYGPLTAYLQGHKFQSNRFLVKPQALLREEDARDGEPSICRTINNFSLYIQMMMQETVLLTLKVTQCQNAPFLFTPYTSSLGVGVTKVVKYPDFTVCQFWGPGVDNHKPDVIRVLIEVGSKKENKWDVARQVLRNLILVGTRFHDEILGVAIVQNEVALLRNQPNGDFGVLYNEFISLFDQRFVTELNRIYTHSIQTDQTTWD
jgi:hypothetical protein